MNGAADPGGAPLELSQGLRFPCPKSFDGSQAKFDDFAYKLRAYLAMSNPRFKEMMTHVQDLEIEPNWAALTIEDLRLGAQLQNALNALCEGPAARIVQRDERSDNGFETWRLLWRRYKPLKRAKATTRLTTILEWKFDFKDFENSFNDWEAEIYRYDSE